MPSGVYPRIRINGKRILSKEARAKMSEWQIGKKLSEGHKKKLSLAHIGKKFSEEHKHKIRMALLGRKRPIWVGQKISEAKKGCKRPDITGEKCHLWRGGITPQNQKIRTSADFYLWREAVFVRDNWTCQKTGEKSGKLNAHHIQNFSKFPTLRFRVENGITLSEKAHRMFHKKYGIKNNNRRQILNYLINAGKNNNE